jgi:hypothetical protein
MNIRTATTRYHILAAQILKNLAHLTLQNQNPSPHATYPQIWIENHITANILQLSTGCIITTKLCQTPFLLPRQNDSQILHQLHTLLYPQNTVVFLQLKNMEKTQPSSPRHPSNTREDPRLSKLTGLIYNCNRGKITP